MPELIRGETGDWEMVIGLEVHAQVISASKLFSGAPTAFGAAPNHHVSLVDAAMPGMLPVLNQAVVDQAIRTGCALKARINLYSVFERKNYFYADLPQGYQISQYLHPIVGEGEIEIDLDDGATRRIGVTRLHLEQDAGKSIHDQHPSKTYVDLNRSGVALMEIVSEPDLRSGEEVAAYIRKLRSILRYVGTCDGNMEEGNLRVDVNLSVRHPGEELGTRCEIKNINSIRFAQQAIEYEARRQIDILENGGSIDQETRLFDSRKGETRSMRSKEEAHDYRYFPDPDLLPLVLEEAHVEALRAALPELPDARKHRFIDQFGLKPYDASVLTAERERAEYYEAVIKGGRDPKLAANWVITELLGALNKSGDDIEKSPISPDGLGLLVARIQDNTISGRIAKDVFARMLETGKDADTIIDEEGLRQVTDTAAIEALIDAVLKDNADKVEQYRAGKDKLFGFFVGQVMKQSGGKANPAGVNELLRARLSG